MYLRNPNNKNTDNKKEYEIGMKKKSQLLVDKKKRSTVHDVSSCYSSECHMFLR